MATQTRIPKIDENNGEKIKKLQIKKVGTTGVESKRAALGELGNRAALKNVESTKENIKEPKYGVNLRNTKARVDTYWKKAPIATKPAIKIEARSTTAGLHHAKLSEVSALKKTTVAIKAANIESRIAANKAKATKPEDIKISSAIRREDSNLSRRSLTKLKAALSKDNKSKTVAEKAETKVKEAKENGQPGEKVQIQLKIVSVQSHSEKLLNEVENIDTDDTANPVLVSEYVNDIYSYLYELEVEFPILENHLKNQKEVTPRMRAVLIDWLNEVHYQFHLMGETFHMTVGIIDRYLQKVANTPREHLQLVGVTALFIAAKYEELYPPEIRDFVYITDDTYTKEQILAMEKKIMKSLDFQLGRPLSIHFLRRYSKAGKAVDCHHLMSKYFLELTTVEYSMAHYRPSEIAASSLFLSLKLLKTSADEMNKFWTPTLEFYSRYSAEHLMPIVKKIAEIVKNAPTAKLRAVYNKYQSSKFERISTKSELTGPVIEKLCSQ